MVCPTVPVRRETGDADVSAFLESSALGRTLVNPSEKDATMPRLRPDKSFIKNLLRSVTNGWCVQGRTMPGSGSVAYSLDQG